MGKLRNSSQGFCFQKSFIHIINYTLPTRIYKALILKCQLQGLLNRNKHATRVFPMPAHRHYSHVMNKKRMP